MEQPRPNEFKDGQFIMKIITNNKIYDELFSSTAMPKKCALCEIGELRELGHIIPKFVMRWLKQASKKNEFYLNNSANEKVRDTIALRILCEDCEDKFSASEKLFTDNYFKRYYRNQVPFEIDDGLYVFAISVAWRLILSTSFLKESAALDKSFKSMLKNARLFLLNQSEDSELDVYVFTANEIESHVVPGLIDERDLKYSIKHSLLAHAITDKSGHFRLSLANVPLVYFKLGVYYFLVTLAGYFERSLFSVNYSKAGNRFRTYKVSYTADFLEFLKWSTNGTFSEVRDILSSNRAFDRRDFL